MAKRYDPIMCMLVDEPTKAQDAARAYSVSYRKGNGPYQSIGVMANSESEAIEKFKKHLANKKQEAEIFGASIGESLETMKRKGKPVLDDRTIDKAKYSASVLDEAIKACDAVEVETSKWSFSSGKSKPSGFGNWWFKIGTEEKNFSGNWSSAKAEAIKYAKEKGISRISLMT